MGEITDIQRWAGSAPGRSRIVAYGGLVWTVAEGSVGDIGAQTADCLRRLEHQLGEAGSDKTRLLSVQIFLSDLALKDAMNAVWTEWIGADPMRWPQRACVAAGLEGQTLIEIVAVAAAGEPRPPQGGGRD